MNDARVRLLVAVSCGLYQGVVWLFPPAFRRTFGPRMTRLFREQCRDALHDQGIAGFAHVWLRCLADIGCALALEWGSILYATWKYGWPYHLLLVLGVLTGTVAMHAQRLPALPLLLFVCAGLFATFQPKSAWEGALRLITGVALARLVDAIIGVALPCSAYLLAVILAAGASLLGAASGVGLKGCLRRWHVWSVTV